MFLIDGHTCWSASDLTAAAECEYGVLRRLDVTLGRTKAVKPEPDALMEQIARLGDKHEARILQEMRQGTASVAPSVVIELSRAPLPYTQAGLLATHEETVAAFASASEVVFQAGFYDGEFHGYADFIERTPTGWRVCDAKLARRARPKALLQLGAYADQLLRADIEVAPAAALLLGNGQTEEFPLVDILPVFRERRARLRSILAVHHAALEPALWGDERYVACGHCAECSSAAKESQDVILVANLRMDQRRKLRAARIFTLSDLTTATVPPPGMSMEAFAKLRAQAALQLAQDNAGPDELGQPHVTYELTDSAPTVLAGLPAPSEGDLFFDFEGDPMYNEGDLSRWGLEYLWGVMNAPAEGQSSGTFMPIWAHDSGQERPAFIEFMELVSDRRNRFPDMHIYHYAPYETTALKRLASLHQTHEKELDDLLRSAVFVDLYATVRGAIRVSQPSYSIKKLEPLYMSVDERRTGDVQAGDTSIVEYHEYRQLVEDGDCDAAEKKLAGLAEYNEYDCLSTLRLRDWLLERADECGVGDLIVPRVLDRAGAEDSDHDALFLALMEKSGSAKRVDRTPDQQAFAMLACALDYYRREENPFWWAHYDRLEHQIEEWSDQRDVFRVDASKVAQDWRLPTPRSRNPRRELELTGEWGPGSTPGSKAGVVYTTPAPPGVEVSADMLLGSTGDHAIALPEGDVTRVLLTESSKPENTHDLTPLALVPAAPPSSNVIRAAIREVATDASVAAALPSRAALDILALRPPRMKLGHSMPSTGDCVADVVTALLGLDESYVAVQGPPGSGKTWTGSRVIKQLVEKHGWRVGVVAQSHAVVENMLDAILKEGLHPSLVAKPARKHSQGAWTDLKDAKASASYLAQSKETGCVIGGTAWTFSAAGLIERRGLDLLVIDEAGQFALAPTLGAGVAAKRLLLLGDPQQLPQVSQGTHAEPVFQSALGWLMQGHDTLPSRLGYFLGTSYRMHPTLCSKVSTLSYDGRLTSAERTEERSLKGVAPGLTVVAIPHQHNRTESVEEAAEIAAQVQSLMGTPWLDPEFSPHARPLDQGDFLVVAPYNAQVNLIHRELSKSGLTEVRVGTVDKFQGREAPVVLMSMTASSHGDVPRGMGFLLSRNRVNVAISRAQWKAFLIRSENLTAFMPTTPDGLLELGAFIGLCGTPAEDQMRCTHAPEPGDG
jgi:predicted RecB family nuclease